MAETNYEEGRRKNIIMASGSFLSQHHITIRNVSGIIKKSPTKNTEQMTRDIMPPEAAEVLKSVDNPEIIKNYIIKEYIANKPGKFDRIMIIIKVK